MATANMAFLYLIFYDFDYDQLSENLLKESTVESRYTGSKSNGNPAIVDV